MASESRTVTKALVAAVVVKVATGIWMHLTELILKGAHLSTHSAARVGLRLAGVMLVLHLVLRQMGGYKREELGLPVTGRTVVQGGLGLALGAIGAALTVGIAVLCGGLTLDAPGAPVELLAVASWAGLLAVNTMGEELIYRAGIAGPLATALPRSLAVVGSALLFGLGAFIPNHSISGLALGNVFLAGLFLALVFFDRANKPLSPALGMAVGAHAGWNLTTMMCGLSNKHGAFEVVSAHSVSALWTGGTSGIEAGLATTVTLAIGIGVLAWRSMAPDAPRPG